MSASASSSVAWRAVSVEARGANRSDVALDIFHVFAVTPHAEQRVVGGRVRGVCLLRCVGFSLNAHGDQPVSSWRQLSTPLRREFGDGNMFDDDGIHDGPRIELHSRRTATLW